jgi:acyl-CoA thioesterase-1
MIRKLLPPRLGLTLVASVLIGLVWLRAAPQPAHAQSADLSGCDVVAAAAAFDYPLSRTARRLAAGQPVKIVALGSSSTAGAGASSPAASYPSRLEGELSALFPDQEFVVLNRGVNGEEASDMLARFDTSVLADEPDLVLWQLGTNSVLRDRPIARHAADLHDGVMRMKAIRSDVVLIDPQFAPRVTEKAGAEAMVAQIAEAAKAEHVDLFHRYEVMRHWYEDQKLPFGSFLAPDLLHLNDWSYGCIARQLAVSIAEAAQRPTATAAVPRRR